MHMDSRRLIKLTFSTLRSYKTEVFFLNPMRQVPSCYWEAALMFKPGLADTASKRRERERKKVSLLPGPWSRRKDVFSLGINNSHK